MNFDAIDGNLETALNNAACHNTEQKRLVREGGSRQQSGICGLDRYPSGCRGLAVAVVEVAVQCRQDACALSDGSRVRPGALLVQVAPRPHWLNAYRAVPVVEDVPVLVEDLQAISMDNRHIPERVGEIKG